MRVRDLTGVTVNGRVLGGRDLSKYLDACRGVPNRLRFRVKPRGIIKSDAAAPFAKLCLAYSGVSVTGFATPAEVEAGDCPYCARGVGEAEDCTCGEGSGDEA